MTPRYRERSKLLLLTGVLITSASLSFGQEPQPTPARVVNLSLIVLDRSGQSVDDIRKDEVRVVENNIPQTLSSFSKADKAVDYGIAIDNSGSFKPLLPVVLKAVARLIENQGASDECFIERFVSSDKIERVQEFTSDKSELLKQLSTLYIESGQSAVVDAIYVAVQHISERPLNSQRRRALILFTDGEDRASYYTENELLQLLRSTEVQLFVIGLVGELDNQTGGSFIRETPQQKAREFLKTITRQTGGRVFFPSKKTDLSEALGEVFHNLHTQYEISYQSTDGDKNNFHPIRIEVTDSPTRQKTTVITRPGYYLNPPEKDSKDKKKKSKKS